MKLEDTLEDFRFLNKLNGTKIITKGNHDYWWSTKSKTEKFLKENGIESIKILFNNAYKVDNVAVCGTRGWFFDCSRMRIKRFLRVKSAG